jgi:hypothetical protein
MPKPTDAPMTLRGFGAVPAVDQDADAPMTELQAARLRDLCARAGEPFDASLTRRQAADRIADLESGPGDDAEE